MRARSLALLSFTLAAFLGASHGRADNPPYPDSTCADSGKIHVSSTHIAEIEGRSVEYVATVGAIETYNETSPSARACLFYTAYTVGAGDSARERPLIFAFNGGPGAASLWLHLGALGPKRVDMGPDGLSNITPARLLPNDQSILDVADLVMIDPIGTGFSQVEGSASIDQFTGTKNDYQSVARFIANYLNREGRQLSPIYVMGESYGGIRGSLLANHLQADYGVNLSGVILISPWLTSLATDFGDPGNNYPYATFLPNFILTAWYHGRMAEKYRVDAQGRPLDEAGIYDLGRNVARGYQAALDIGYSQLPKLAQQRLTQKLSDLLGLPTQWLTERNLKVSDTDFFPAVLGQPNLAVGRFDSRFTGPKLGTQTGGNVPDPSDTKTNGPFTAAINQYLRQELGFQTGREYVTGASFNNWSFNSDATALQVLDDLGKALNYKASFRVFIASGYYDLACPMGTVDYALSQLDPGVVRYDAAGHDRITRRHYSAGHMMYINPVALRGLKSDLKEWLAGAPRAASPIQP